MQQTTKAMIPSHSIKSRQSNHQTTTEGQSLQCDQLPQVDEKNYVRRPFVKHVTFHLESPEIEKDESIILSTNFACHDRRLANQGCFQNEQKPRVKVIQSKSNVRGEVLKTSQAISDKQKHSQRNEKKLMSRSGSEEATRCEHIGIPDRKFDSSTHCHKDVSKREALLRMKALSDRAMVLRNHSVISKPDVSPGSLRSSNQSEAKKRQGLSQMRAYLDPKDNQKAFNHELCDLSDSTFSSRNHQQDTKYKVLLHLHDSAERRLMQQVYNKEFFKDEVMPQPRALPHEAFESRSHSEAEQHDVLSDLHALSDRRLGSKKYKDRIKHGKSESLRDLIVKNDRRRPKTAIRDIDVVSSPALGSKLSYSVQKKSSRANSAVQKRKEKISSFWSFLPIFRPKRLVVNNRHID